MSIAAAVIAPAPEDIALAGEAMARIDSAIRSGEHVRLRVEGEPGEVIVPQSAISALAKILESMSKGGSVSVLPAGAELTTQQAADALNVSRPFLVGLLDAGEIAFRKVGTHRRVFADSLATYMLKDYQQAKAAADELAAEAFELGLV
ncbi:MAG: helix-turn-helix domain-containing protein [Propionibacteriaceae bacterium]|jgi:excisionase family DNA binding protein|nr:helix-turn-helix domain-containing protein [Propionibacteriaceae bacterium]